MKKKMNKKALLILVSVLMVVAIIMTSSFINASIDPSYWSTPQFISNTAITISLCIFGAVAGENEGDNYYRTNEKGLFVATYNGYNEQREKINPIIDKFSDWNENLFKNEYSKKIIRYLKNDYGVKQAELILQLDRNQIVQLTEPKCFKVNKEDRYFNSLTKEQIDAIIGVLDGKMKIKFVHDGYFLNAYTNNKGKSMYEQAGKQDKTKRLKFILLMTQRIGTTIVIGLIMTGLTIDSKQGVVIGQAVLNLFSRLFTLGSAFSWGFFVANDMIKDECTFIDYKKTTLEKFWLDVEVNKTFVAKTEEEKALEKIKIKEEKENEREREETKANIHS